MVYAGTVLDSVEQAISTGASAGPVPSGALPSGTVTASKRLDGEGEDANVTLPVIELAPVDVRRDQSLNSDVHGYETNNSGDQIGKIYLYHFTMPVEIDVMTASTSTHDHRTMTRSIREILSEYDTRSGDSDLPDPNNANQTLSGISLEVGNREPVHDFSTSPALRVSRLTVDTRFSHELKQSNISGAKTPIAKVSQDIDLKDKSGTAHDAWDQPV